jgi:hypothetical protein
VEYEGMSYQGGKSRHLTIKGYTNDLEKYSWAAILGWCVIRVNAEMVRNGLAYELIEEAIYGQNGQ